MKILKKWFGLGPGATEETSYVEDGMHVFNDAESFTVLIPSITDTTGTVERKVIGTVMDNEGDTWEVSAASGMVWLHNQEEELFSSFNGEFSAELLNLLADAVEAAHA